MNKDKIIIAFNTNNNKSSFNKRTVITKIFEDSLNDSKVTENDTILKSLVWKTKYYQSSFDLYIDEFEDLQIWLDDLLYSDCDELRSVLAGVIIVDSLDLSHNGAGSNTTNETIQLISEKLINKLHDDSFLILCNNDDTVSNEKLIDLNNQLAIDGSQMELVHLPDLSGMNEINDRVGYDRIQEIIDTHPWDNMDKTEVAIDKDQRDETDIPINDQLNFLMNKLNEAKTKYQSLRNEIGDDSNKFAEEIAKEIAKYL